MLEIFINHTKLASNKLILNLIEKLTELLKITLEKQMIKAESVVD